jgi:hypothetical protein
VERGDWRDGADPGRHRHRDRHPRIETYDYADD